MDVTSTALKMAGAGVSVFIAGALFGALLTTAVSRSGPEAAPASQVAAPPLAAEPQPVKLSDPGKAETLAGARDGLRIGRVDAPVQIVSFEDPLCGYCKQLQTGPYRQLMDDYVKAGKVAIVYRHYPFLAPESRTLSVALECAGQQGRFEALHGELTLSTSGTVNLDTWPGRAGADPGRFSACLGSEATRSVVDADLALGRKFEVRGTPTIFVNGKRLIGLMPYEQLKSVVDEALRT
jgi:protein-disulfide isomerase